MAPVELVRVDFGRWVWWPDFQAVEYIPKGKRKAAHTIYLHAARNTLPGALRAIIWEISPHRAGNDS